MPHDLNTAAFQPFADASQKIAVVVSTYNSPITSKLKQGALSKLMDLGAAEDSIIVVPVPGAWELPYGVQQSLVHGNCAGVIALGVVIRGDTTHDQHINRAVSNSMMQLSLEHQKPVAFGLLTVNNLEQAIQRSGGNLGNKGEEAAEALYQCLSTSAALQSL